MQGVASAHPLIGSNYAAHCRCVPAVPLGGGPSGLFRCRSGRSGAHHRFGSRLLDAQAGDGPADHELLDLLGALEDVEGVLEPFGEPRPLQ